MRSLRIVAVLWAALGIAAYVYAQDQNISSRLTLALLPAFLFEATLYFASIHSAIRARIEKRFTPVPLAAAMIATALIPYGFCTLILGAFDRRSAMLLLALAAAQSFWYILLPKRSLADFGFIALAASPVLLDLFDQLYGVPAPKLKLGILGMAMWVRNGVLSVLSMRRMEGINAGFLPNLREWRIGALHFLLFLPLGLLLAAALQFAALRDVPLEFRTVLVVLGTFLGFLWVVALAEEFFFRGMLQQILRRALKSGKAALVLSSILFGLSHLGFRQFPNWRFALLAALAGLFYGSAYMRSGSIRAAMVTHAMVVTTWKVFLR